MRDQSKRLDAIDARLLDLLQRDGRSSNLALARQVGLTATPCQERVRRLEREGFIEGYSARLSAERLDLALLVLVHVTLNHGEPGVFDRFLEEIRTIPNIVECLMVTGQFDYLLKIRVADMQSYREILGDRLSSIKGVAQTNSFVVIEECLSDGLLPIKSGS